MAPPNPKRPPRGGGKPGDGTPPAKPERANSEIDLPFDDAEVTPLHADDPRPQRVIQYPANAKRPAGSKRNPRRMPTEILSALADDRELRPSYDSHVSEPGWSPAFLYVERGPGTGQLLPVNQGAVILGRSSTADLRLQHPSISRRHAQLVRVGERFYVKDFQSQNGTFVNRRRVTEEVEFHPGDQLALGTASLRLRGAGQPSESQLATELAQPPEALPTPAPKPGLYRAAIFVGAVSFGLACVLMLALRSGTAPRRAPPDVAPGRIALTSPSVHAPLAPSPPERAQPVEPVPVPVAVRAEVSRAPEPRVATEARVSPVTPSASPPPPLKVTRAPRLPPRKFSGVATHPETVVKAAVLNHRRAIDVDLGAAAEPTPASEASEPDDARVKAQYEQGDVAAALRAGGFVVIMAAGATRGGR